MASLSSRWKICLVQWPLGTLLALLCVAFSANPCHAQLYKWTDENGKTHYSDSIPPTAVDRARKEMRPSGVVKNSLDRAMTPEEKRQAELTAADDEKARIILRERDRKDKALLATYPDLKDFDRVRDRALTALDNDIKGLLDLIAPPPVAPVAATSVAATAKTGTASTPGKAVSPLVSETASAAQVAATAEQRQRQRQRIASAVAKKRVERADMAALYEGERTRLAALIATERARVTAGAAPVSRQ